MTGKGSIIHTAISNGHFHQVRFLIDKGASVNERDADGRTPLIRCASITDNRWSVSLARLLIENGARIALRDKQGFNALHHACVNQRDDLVQVYASSLDCDVHSKCSNGNTSLHYAASLGNKAIVEELARLVVRYKLTMDPTNKRGLTPLHQAFKANQIDCGDMLVEYGADVTCLDLENKSAAQYRQDALDRLQILAQQRSRKRPNSKLVRKIRDEAESEKPKVDGVTIKVAKEFDLRNDPEYVFKTSAVNYFNNKDASRMINRQQTAVDRKPKSDIWKDEIMGLWSHYETRFSDSYRMPAKITPLSVEQQTQFTNALASMTPPKSRRNSKVAGKPLTGSMADVGTSSRRSSVTTRRNGMPPLVRTQTRTNLNP